MRIEMAMLFVALLAFLVYPTGMYALLAVVTFGLWGDFCTL